MMSIVELDDPGPAGADSTGLAVWFMVGACVRLNEVAGYRRRARSLQELVGNRKRLNRQKGTCGLSRRVYGRENKHDGEAFCLLYPQEALPACSGLMGWDASYEEDAPLADVDWTASQKASRKTQPTPRTCTKAAWPAHSFVA
jgi:hypothetical protein